MPSTAKPSDLIPELQGRFPIRVELPAPSAGDFHPQRLNNALTKQYTAPLGTEGVQLEFTADGIERWRRSPSSQRTTENTRPPLHTVLERLLEGISYEAPDRAGEHYRIDAAYVDEHLSDWLTRGPEPYIL